MQGRLFRWAGTLLLGLVVACGEPALDDPNGDGEAPVQAGPGDADTTPGLLPANFVRNTTQQELASPNALAPVVTETGFITLSVDGVGTTAASGIVQAQKPAGATVRRAFLAAASTGASSHQIPSGAVRIDNQNVIWSRSVPSSISSWNHFAEVTALVKPKLDAAAAGRVSFTISETTSSLVDGEVLAVIFDTPSQTTVNTAILLFGAQSTTGDTFNISLAEPLNKNDPNLALELSLGISFGYQTGSPSETQHSTIDINGARLTSQAGGQDDGQDANGALLTVGGLDDSTANPSPFAGGPGPRTDDELYDLKPFVAQGAQQIVINTLNPSNDDNIFFAALSLRAAAAVVGEGIVLGPTQSTGEVGTAHTVTASLQDDLGRPLANRVVSFRVTSGPNAGLTGQATTDSTGRASFTYTGTGGPGRDSIQASFVKSTGETALSNLALRDWTQTRRPPVAVCRNLTLDAGPSCGASGSVNNGSSDPDGDLSGCTQSPAGPYGPGSTSVTLTCTDSTGLSSSCTATVTVTDSTSPAISCPADQQAECVDQGATVTVPRASASDNCGTPTVTGPGATRYPLGSTQVTQSATDASGNRVSCSSNVVVRDTQSPALALNPANTVLECRVSTYNEAGATASDACFGNLSSSVVTSGSVDTTAPGSYGVTYRVTDPAGNSSSGSRVYTVRDTLAPTVTPVGPASVSLECNLDSYVDLGATASDICAGNLTSAVTTSGAVNASQPGNYTVSYAVVDPAGLRATATRSVSVQDTLAPSVSLVGPASATLECNAGTFDDPGATASDVCAGDLTGAIVRSGSVDTGAVGSYTLTYTAADAAYNSASVSRTVTVVDTQGPSITCPGPMFVEATSPAGAEVTPAPATASDVCGLASVTGPAAGLYAPGTHTVTYTATDSTGQSASCSTVINVIDRSSPPPKLTMCDLPRYTNADFVKACGFLLPGGSGAAITYAYFRVNGGAPMQVQPDASGGTVIQILHLDEGTYTIELTAIDALGGIATDTRVVTVDRTAPVIRILSPLPDENQPSQLVDIVSEVTDVAPSIVTTNWVHRTDVDAGTSIVSHTVFLPQTGYNQIIVNAVDEAGNAASVTQIIYVDAP